MTTSVTVLAPAKVNLLLEILSKRPDGYHELQMIMAGISLYDKITITPSDHLYMTCNDAALPLDESNLVIQAALAFIKFTNRSVNAHIHLEKRIPSAAGLGGGSSDAAATLRGLDQYCSTGLNPGDLEKLGVALGADVPFFVRPGHKIARGIGERLSPITLNTELNLVLINPGYPLSTAEIYRKFRLTSKVKQTNVPPSLKGLSEVVRLLRNDLEPVVLANHPEVAAIKRLLENSGCSGCLMSGSGPTVFGIFEDAKLIDGVVKKAIGKGYMAWAAGTVSDWA